MIARTFPIARRSFATTRMAIQPNYMERQKQQTKQEEYPNAPTATRRAEPESETPAGQSGSFSDHRGGGPRVEGEAAHGKEDAAETRTVNALGKALKKGAEALTGRRGYATKAHPGYTTEDAPITSDKSELPKAPEGAKPSSQGQPASTKAGDQHKGVKHMAEGGKHGGSDAIKAGERTPNSWGANARSAQFNEDEQKRRPLKDGGSHEANGKP